MATKTFEELKQLAIQIRDEKTNKQNTATRVGTAMLEHINKLEQDYYDKTQTDEELKERDDKLTELEFKSIGFKKEYNVVSQDGVYNFSDTILTYGTEKLLVSVNKITANFDSLGIRIYYGDGSNYFTKEIKEGELTELTNSNGFNKVEFFFQTGTYDLAGNGSLSVIVSDNFTDKEIQELQSKLGDGELLTNKNNVVDSVNDIYNRLSNISDASSDRLELSGSDLFTREGYYLSESGINVGTTYSITDILSIFDYQDAIASLQKFSSSSALPVCLFADKNGEKLIKAIRFSNKSNVFDLSELCIKYNAKYFALCCITADVDNCSLEYNSSKVNLEQKFVHQFLYNKRTDKKVNIDKELISEVVNGYEIFSISGYTSATSISYNNANFNITDFIKIEDFDKIIFAIKSFSSSTAIPLLLLDADKSVVKAIEFENKYSNQVEYFDVLDLAKDVDAVYVIACSSNANTTDDYVVLNYLGSPSLDYKLKDIYKKISEIIPSSICNGYKDLGINNLARLDEFDYNIVLCYGQSLSIGQGVFKGSVVGPSNAYRLGTTYINVDNATTNGEFTQINRTWGSAVSTQIPPSVGAVINLAARYNQETRNQSDKNFVSICCGVGGQTVAQLMDTTKYRDVSSNEFYFPNIVVKNTDEDTGLTNNYAAIKKSLQGARNAADALGKSVGVVAILWIQGENDYTGTGTPDTDTAECSCNSNSEEWIKRSNRLISDIKEDIRTILQQEPEPAVFIGQTAGNFMKNNFAINKGQLNICDNRKIFQLPSNYPYSNTSDGHLTPNGSLWQGELIAQNVFDVTYKNKDVSRLRVKDVKVINNKIYISYTIPTPPLRFEVNSLAKVDNYGFYVKVNNVVQPISDVEIYNDIVIITLDKTIQTNDSLHIEYATYNSQVTGLISPTDEPIIARGEGNICDSSNYMGYGLCQEDYDRSEDVVVEYYPKMQDGSPLIGNKYPLEHFCEAFVIDL